MPELDDAQFIVKAVNSYHANQSLVEEMRLEIERLREAIRCVVEDGVMETSGAYNCSKNNKCHHGNFGFEGCEACIEEFLARALRGENNPLIAKGNKKACKL